MPDADACSSASAAAVACFGRRCMTVNPMCTSTKAPSQRPRQESHMRLTSDSRTGAERGGWHAPPGRLDGKGRSAQRGAGDASGAQAVMQAARRWGHLAVGVCGLELHLHSSLRVQCMLIAQHG